MAESNENIDQILFDAEPTSYLNIQILKCDAAIEVVVDTTFDHELIAEWEGKKLAYQDVLDRLMKQK